MAGVKSPGPSRERGNTRKIWAVFVVVHGACENCSFSEDQGGLEQLVYHDSLRQKLAILTR